MTDPTAEYLQVFEQLRRRRRWSVPVDVLRLSALVLAAAGRMDAAARLDDVVRELRARERWGGALRSSLAYPVAALVLSRNLDPARVHEAATATRAMFRDRKVRRGGISELLAAVLMAVSSGGRVPPPPTVERFAAIVADWRRDHPFLTGPADYPLAALHALREEPVAALTARVEEIYRGLRARRYRMGNGLQLASHLLAIADGPASRLVVRFAAVARALGERGHRPRPSTYDEVALISLADGPPARLAMRVARLTDRLRQARPRPSRQVAFSLAAGLLLGEGVRQLDRRGARDLAALRAAQAAIVAQQAAIAAAVAATTATTVAATSSR